MFLMFLMTLFIVEAGNFDAWSTQVNIIIQNNFSIDMNNAPIRINLARDLSTFDKDNFEPNGEDIRFVDGTGNNLSSFVEFWSTGDNESAIVWVGVTIPAESNVTIALFHGNAGVNDVADFSFMDLYQNFTSGTTPSGWLLSQDNNGAAGFDNASSPFSSPFSAYVTCEATDCDNANFNPPLPPSTNYTVDFYYWVSPTDLADNTYWHDSNNIFRWDVDGVTDDEQPLIAFECTNSSGDNFGVSAGRMGVWIRAKIDRQRAPENSIKSMNHTQVRIYINESLYGQCNGTRAGFATTQTRLNWSISSGNRGPGSGGTLKVDNFKIYKNFGWNTSDTTLYPGVEAGCNYFGDDWIIANGNGCVLNTSLTINGNLNISNGSLELQSNAALTVLGGFVYVEQHSSLINNLTIDSGGQLNG